MRKKEAAAFLGIAVRTLELYVHQCKISVVYETGKTRPTANFDEVELEKFKEELQNPTIKPAFQSRQISQSEDLNEIVSTYEEPARFNEIQTSEGLIEIIKQNINQIS